MSTKLKGDIAEQTAIVEALKRGWEVLKPVGDRLSYDMVFDVGGVLVKIQVKSAWFHNGSNNYVVDNRRTKTNRRNMVHESYRPADFDFSLVYIPELSMFYVFPIDVFIEYGSEIHLVEVEKRQRKPRSGPYRNAWKLISEWAAHGVNCVRSPVKFGEANSVVIPSQASLKTEEGVETRWQASCLKAG